MRQAGGNFAIVIGGRNSANTHRLRELCEETGIPAYQVETADEIGGLTTAFNEMLGQMLLSVVNLYYYQDIMLGMRAAIAERRFDAYRQELKAGWAQGDLPPL